MIVTFLMTAPTAEICTPIAYIQKLVRLEHSIFTLCAIFIYFGCVLPVISPIAAHHKTGFVNHSVLNFQHAHEP